MATRGGGSGFSPAALLTSTTGGEGGFGRGSRWGTHFCEEERQRRRGLRAVTPRWLGLRVHTTAAPVALLLRAPATKTAGLLLFLLHPFCFSSSSSTSLSPSLSLCFLLFFSSFFLPFFCSAPSDHLKWERCAVAWVWWGGSELRVSGGGSYTQCQVGGFFGGKNPSGKYCAWEIAQRGMDVRAWTWLSGAGELG